MSFCDKKCVPCEGGISPLSAAEIQENLKQTPDWQVSADNKSLKRNFKFRNFAQSLDFTNKVGKIAEEEGHHPDIEMGWGYCNITLQTHSIGGLHENDFIVASKIDKL